MSSTIPVSAAAAGANAHLALFDFADAVGGVDAAPPAPASELHLVTFRLGEGEFGVPIQTAREVIRVGEITRVPQAPEHIRGVTNLRGRILPVVEIRTRLGLAPAEPTPRSRIVVAEVRGRVIGLLVDAVGQVMKVPADAVKPPPEEVVADRADYVTGVATLPGRMILLLDLERAFGPSDVRPTGRERQREEVR